MILSLERVKTALMGLGLSETDVQVYVFLALNGPHKGRDIINELKLYKKKLFRSLKKLQDKDVVKVSDSFPAEFFAVPFEEMLDLIAQIKKEQAKALQETKEELLSSWNNMVKENSYKS